VLATNENSRAVYVAREVRQADSTAAERPTDGNEHHASIFARSARKSGAALPRLEAAR